MKIRSFAQKIADLVLTSDEGTEDWIRVGPLRISFYWWLGSIVGYFVLTVIGLQLEIFATSKFAAATLRFVLIAILIGGIGGLFTMCRLYYAHVLRRTVGLSLNNVVFFYVAAVVMFGTCYNQLYRVNASLFSYPNPPVTPNVLWVSSPLEYQLQRLDFLLFSALQSVNGGYYRISSHSLIISALGYIQAVFTICLLALLVAAYVNRKSELR